VRRGSRRILAISEGFLPPICIPIITPLIWGESSVLGIRLTLVSIKISRKLVALSMMGRREGVGGILVVGRFLMGGANFWHRTVFALNSQIGKASML
jgi:hypothetical protein